MRGHSRRSIAWLGSTAGVPLHSPSRLSRFGWAGPRWAGVEGLGPVWRCFLMQGAVLRSRRSLAVRGTVLSMWCSLVMHGPVLLRRAVSVGRSGARPRFVRSARHRGSRQAQQGVAHSCLSWSGLAGSSGARQSRLVARGRDGKVRHGSAGRAQTRRASCGVASLVATARRSAGHVRLGRDGSIWASISMAGEAAEGSAGRPSVRRYRAGTPRRG